MKGQVCHNLIFHESLRVSNFLKLDVSLATNGQNPGNKLSSIHFKLFWNNFITDSLLLLHIISALILSIYKMWGMIFFFRKKFFWSKLGVMILSRAWHMKILIHGPAVFLPPLCTKLSGCSPSSGFLFWMNGLHPLLHHNVLIWTNQSCWGILFKVICRVGDELESWRKIPFKATSLTQWVQK